MAPDINTLRSSRSSSITSTGTARHSITGSALLETVRDQTPSPSRTASTSLTTAATLTSGLQHDTANAWRRPSSGSISRNITSPRAGRRQSTILMNLQLNEPVVPGLGEMVNEDHPALSRGSMAGSPTTHFADLHHRGRNPSLGELHQELEQEQEAHVNRLLQQIRQQQIQLDQLQARGGGQLNNSTVDESLSATHTRSSYEFIETPSRTASPRVRADSFSDNSAHFQAETQIIIRENQMLKTRIIELERQLYEATLLAAVTHEPTSHSVLERSEFANEQRSANLSGIYDESDPILDESKD